MNAAERQQLVDRVRSLPLSEYVPTGHEIETIVDFKPARAVYVEKRDTVADFRDRVIALIEGWEKR